MTDSPDSQTPPRPARLPSAERQALILEAALEEFAARGFAGARMAAVASRAGVTKGLLYHYFPGGKPDLFQSVVTACVEPALAEARQMTGSFQGTARELLTALMEIGYARVAAEKQQHRILMKLLLTEADHFPELSGLYRDVVLQPAMRVLEAVLRAGAANGEFRPGVLEEPGLAHVLLAPVMMGSVWHLLLGPADAPDLDAMRAAHLDLMLRALLA
ncbi:TetR/AcrR family transcriptional regulator [Roseomonas marmotae]|uniref:TetR/AcrR family transcriptional regulator n=1 Tax=Roseomonas marmotae TaxID=2768161 RepID=A0ABS3KEP0_9PROT|nr:TetR/AcrR family transcriptional regulator [Roseomonas marmotae]MBO1075924.1 TetR/AcrR family transcriptional regulator [Roseomonas marmotae]QTI81893.1 TetR/AcrR family transcriptional regulator [Roseomonas marmotae]